MEHQVWVALTAVELEVHPSTAVENDDELDCIAPSVPPYGSSTPMPAQMGRPVHESEAYSEAEHGFELRGSPVNPNP